MDKLVVLARGVGSRMRKDDRSAILSKEQADAASRGAKGMMPVGRRLFLDYVLNEAADAGFKRVCLVIGPEHSEIRRYYLARSDRLHIECAVQDQPLGTADAVRSAEIFAKGEPFAMINSDNLYPREALVGLRELRSPGLSVFDREGLLAGSNIPAERLVRFAVVDIAGDGTLRRIVEKPDAETLSRMGPLVHVSMNCWRFDASIFEACAKITPSPRGEFEITDAVQYSIDRIGVKFQVLCYHAPVLDLSSRQDIGPVGDRLAGREVRL